MSTNVTQLYELQMQGEEVPQEPILIDASFFMNFILANHKTFEGLSVQSAVEHIVARGKAEIERTIKTAIKTKENKVYGDLARQFNMTLEQAKSALEAAALKAKSAQ